MILTNLVGDGSSEPEPLGARVNVAAAAAVNDLCEAKQLAASSICLQTLTNVNACCTSFATRGRRPTAPRRGEVTRHLKEGACGWVSLFAPQIKANVS